MKKIRVLTLVALLGPAACSSNVTGAQEADLAILFIGNSLTYANDLPAMVANMLDVSLPGGVFVESIAKPNYGLEDHWNDSSTRDRIDGTGWDVVIMQQGPSATEGRPSLIDYSARFAELIRGSGAKPALFMVWPAEERSFDFGGVRDSYRAAADSVDGYFFPAGAAWQEAWKLDSSLALYGSDGFHPSQLGSYLAAVVIVQQLADLSAAELDVNFDSRYVSSTIGRVLHRAANEANDAHGRDLDTSDLDG